MIYINFVVESGINETWFVVFRRETQRTLKRDKRYTFVKHINRLTDELMKNEVINI